MPEMSFIVVASKAEATHRYFVVNLLKWIVFYISDAIFCFFISSHNKYPAVKINVDSCYKCKSA